MINFWKKMYFMGWGSREGGNNNLNNFQIAAAARGWKFWISYSSLVLLRDVEKETHKQQVLWEKKLVYLKSGWGWVQKLLC